MDCALAVWGEQFRVEQENRYLRDQDDGAVYDLQYIDKLRHCKLGLSRQSEAQISHLIPPNNLVTCKIPLVNAVTIVVIV